MTSAIDPTKPVFGTPTTQSVRDNFSAAKSEIESLQSDVATALTRPTDTFETWTPELTFTTPGDLSVSYTLQTGTYEVIGKRLFWEMTLVTSSMTFTTASGQLNITGLPVAAKSGTGTNTYGGMQYNGMTLIGHTQVTPRVAAGASVVTFQKTGSGVASAQCDTTNFTTGTNVAVLASGSYPID